MNHDHSCRCSSCIPPLPRVEDLTRIPSALEQIDAKIEHFLIERRRHQEQIEHLDKMVEALNLAYKALS